MSNAITVVSSGVIHDDGAYAATYGTSNKLSVALTYKVVYSAPVLTAAEAHDIAIAQGAIPDVGATIPGTSLKVTSLQFTNLQSSPTVWKVQVEHSDNGGGGGGGGGGGDSVLEGVCYDAQFKVNAKQRVANYAYECKFIGLYRGYHHWLEPDMTTAYQKASGVQSWDSNDADGNENAPVVPIVNSAGDKYADPVMEDYYTLSISWWQLAPKSYNPGIIQNNPFSYIGSLSKGGIYCGMSMDSDTIIRDIQPEAFMKAKQLRWKVHFTVEKKLGANPVGWWSTDVLCTGYNYINNSVNMTAATPIVKQPITKRAYAYVKAIAAGKNDENAKKEASQYKPDDLIPSPALLTQGGDILAGSEAPVLQCFRVAPIKDWSTMACPPAAKVYKQNWEVA